MRRCLLHWFTLAFSAIALGQVLLAETYAEYSVNERAEVQIYRKSLGDIGDLVITRGPERPVNEVLRIYPKEICEDDYTNCYDVSIAIQLKDTKPVTIATLLARDMMRYGGYDVLDASFHDGAFVVATAENGGIVLTRIRPTSFVPVVATRLRGWTKAAAMVRIDRTMVHAELAWTKHGLVQVNVDDLRPNMKQRTRFIQSKDGWTFAASTE